MAFIDEYTCTAYAGKGGDGVVRWTREKFRPNGGPCGGNGGKGGNVYFEGVRDINALMHLTHTETFRAEDGQAGSKDSKTGRGGEDVTIRVPTGSLITNKKGISFEILRDGERVCALEGGEGGFGNEHFKSSTNRAPEQCTLGKEGEFDTFHIELQIIADVGLVGLPNAGKTSILNALTNADAKVASYPFTTLDPNLGVYFGYIIADIPGLIEGASFGKGLGHKFLRHIARTKIVLHCISLERDTLAIDYSIIRRELDAYGKIADKKELILFTKKDTLSEEEAEERIVEFSKIVKNTNVLGTVSILDESSVKKTGDALVRILKAM